MAFDLASAKPAQGFDLASAKPVQSDEPGWFEPGSKSEAAIRGFSQAATMRFGDEIQAYLRAIPDIGSKEGYFATANRLKQEERGANSTAANTNPGSYLAGSVAGALPQAANIASVARTAAPIAGSVAAGRAAAAGGAGAVYGAAQGAGNANTMSEVPGEMAQGAAIGGAVNAAIPVAGAALSAAGRYGTKAVQGATKANEALPPGITRNSVGNLVNEAGEVVNRLGKKIAGPEWANVDKGSSLKTGSAIAQGAAPSLGGLAGYFSGPGSNDPAQSIADKLGNAAKGAAVGWGASKAAPIVGAAVGGLKSAGQAMLRGGGNVFSSELGQTAASAGATAASPFGRITDYLTQAEGATNPEVQQAAEQAQQIVDEGDEAKKRKAAMALSADPTGRAVGNSTSPVR